MTRRFLDAVGSYPTRAALSKKIAKRPEQDYSTLDHRQSRIDGMSSP